MDGAQLARWTRFAGKGGIGKCTAIRDCIAESGDDLMFLKDDPIIVLMQLPSPDEGWYLGYCEGVVGRFNGADVQFEKGERLKKPVLAKRGSTRLSSLEVLDTPKSPLFSKGTFIEEEKIPEVEDKAKESLTIAPPTTTDAVEDVRPLSDGDSVAVSLPESTSGSSTVRESTTISVAETAVDRESAGMNIGFALLQESDDEDDSSVYSSEEDTLPTVEASKQIAEDSMKENMVETAAIKSETTTTTTIVEEEREAVKEEEEEQSNSDEDPSKSPSLSVWDIYDDYRYSRATMHQSLSTSSVHSTNGPLQTLPSPLLHTRFSNSSPSASPTSSTFPSEPSPVSAAPLLLPPPSPLAPSLPPEVTSPPSTPPLMVRKRIHPSASDGPRESLFLPHPNAPRAPSTAPEEPPTSNNLIPTLNHVLTLPRGATIYGRTLADLSSASGPVGITFTVDPPPLPPPPPIFAPRTSSPLRTRSSVSALRESPSPLPRPFNGPPAPRPRSRSFSDLHTAAVQQITPSPTRMRTASAAPPVVTTTTPSPPSRLRSNSVAPKPTLTRLSFESPPSPVPSSPTTTSASHSLSLLTKIPESNSELLPPPSNESPLTASSPASLSAFPMPPRGNSPASLSSFPLPPTLPPPSITPTTSPPRKLSLPNLRARTVSHRAATLQAQRPPSFQSRPSVSESIRPSLDTGSIKSQSSAQQIQVKSTEFELVAPSPISTSPSTSSPSSPFPPTRPMLVERQKSAQEKQQDRDRENKFLAILSTPKSKQKKLRKLVMEGGGIPMSVRWLVWMELVGGEKDGKEQPSTNGAMGGGILTSGPRGKSQAALTALLASETSSASSPAEKLARAYRRMCPDVAASDELSSILTFLLALAPEQDAFWIFCCVMDSSLRGYFTADEQALEIDGELFARALGKADGQLAHHLLTTLGIPAGKLIREAGVRKGFIGVIRDSDGDEEELRRVWDVWVCDGLPTVIKTLLTIVTLLRAKLMSCKTDSEAKDLLRRGVCVGRGEIERIGRERGWKVPEEEIRRERARMTRVLFESRGKGRGKAHAGLVGGRGRGISLPVR
ncbi:hypothetical protein ARMSODRAFT_1086268 [Armillaria solidipes]|uniref:SH3 domain-containing protein n=1 Tax=Armillaria solidipes TaxID=1076256 RepID=A0A2H3BMR3_9AGAR|nr:hypothetical protein ARMSODRAFT_1086268 [Armillaria solidipes]